MISENKGRFARKIRRFHYETVWRGDISTTAITEDFGTRADVTFCGPLASTRAEGCLEGIVTAEALA